MQPNHMIRITKLRQYRFLAQRKNFDQSYVLKKFNTQTTESLHSKNSDLISYDVSTAIPIILREFLSMNWLFIIKSGADFFPTIM